MNDLTEKLGSKPCYKSKHQLYPHIYLANITEHQNIDGLASAHPLVHPLPTAPFCTLQWTNRMPLPQKYRWTQNQCSETSKGPFNFTGYTVADLMVIVLQKNFMGI